MSHKLLQTRGWGFYQCFEAPLGFLLRENPIVAPYSLPIYIYIFHSLVKEYFIIIAWHWLWNLYLNLVFFCSILPVIHFKNLISMIIQPHNKTLWALNIICPLIQFHIRPEGIQWYEAANNLSLITNSSGNYK